MKLFLEKYNQNTVFLLFVGILAALFFSFTFALNRANSLDGISWYWAASIRYVFTVLFLSIFIIVFNGFKYYKSVINEFFSNLKFWLIAGTIGFGFFYFLLCYSADYSPGWIIATTWQITIICSLFVLWIFGQKLSKKIWIYSVLIFSGVTLVNFSHFDFDNLDAFILGFFPVLIAAFCYPFGNQLVWEKKKKRIEKGENLDILNNGLVKAFLLVLGSTPLWIVLFFFAEKAPVTVYQVSNIAIISLFSGVFATSLFLYARNKANTSTKIMVVDSAQSLEVIFTLFAEVIFLSGLFPNSIGIIGIAVTFTGLYFLVKSD